MLIQRKKIGIYAYDLDKTIYITYNVGSEEHIENVQFWVREDKKYEPNILYKLNHFMRELQLIGSDNLIEKDIFRTYQDVFYYETVLQNYEIEIDQFTTKKIANDLIPHLNFNKITKNQIDTFFTVYLKNRKGETNE